MQSPEVHTSKNSSHGAGYNDKKKCGGIAMLCSSGLCKADLAGL